jgi:hypothetical protein
MWMCLLEIRFPESVDKSPAPVELPEMCLKSFAARVPLREHGALFAALKRANIAKL